MRPAINLSGKRFGKLLVLTQAASDPVRGAAWNCQCDCGNTSVVRAKHLKGGQTRSCGCIRMALQRTKALNRKPKHGEARKANQSLEYKTWSWMLARCHNPKVRCFRNYGGRGITVCERWRTFENFLADMGRKPPGSSIDRIDVNGNYEPSNCRWVNRAVQSNNCRSNVHIELDGRRKTMAEWAKELGMSSGTLWQRLNSGWSPRKALTTPVRKCVRRKLAA
jgi:hypothetical protein